MSTILLVSTEIVGQVTAPVGGPPSGIGGLLSSPMSLVIPLMLVFLYFSVTSKRKQEKDRKALLDSMKRGDRVEMIGGIFGTIVDVRETEVVVKVDESNNTKIKFSRAAVSRVIGDDDKADSGGK